MKLAIELIKVDEAVRIRQELGNLQRLEKSIDAVGLLNPILIDEQSNLVAGFRRLQACRNLGMKEVEVRIVEFNGDQLKMLEVEVAENFFRKDFTPEEVLASEKRRLELVEAARPKGVFERFWRWLKRLFSSKPAATASPSSSSAAANGFAAAEGAGGKVDKLPDGGDKTTEGPSEEAGEARPAAEPADTDTKADDDSGVAEEPDAVKRKTPERPAAEEKRVEKGADTHVTKVFPDTSESDRSIRWRNS